VSKTLHLSIPYATMEYLFSIHIVYWMNVVTCVTLFHLLEANIYVFVLLDLYVYCQSTSGLVKQKMSCSLKYSSKSLWMSIENSSFFFIEKYIIKCIFWILILKIQFYFIWMEDSSFHLIWKTCVSAIIMYKPSFVYNHDIHFFDKMSVYNCHFLLIIRHNSTAKINTAVKFMNNIWFTFCFLSKNL